MLTKCSIFLLPENVIHKTKAFLTSSGAMKIEFWATATDDYSKKCSWIQIYRVSYSGDLKKVSIDTLGGKYQLH